MRALHRLVLLAAAFCASCSCGAPVGHGGNDAATPDDTNRLDAYFPDVPPGPELCTDGIRRVDVSLPAVTAGSDPDLVVARSRAWVGAGEVVAARVDAAANVQFARIDPTAGIVRQLGVGQLPVAIDAILGLRELGDGTAELLLSSRLGSTTSFVVATFDSDAALVSAVPISAPMGASDGVLQSVAGAAPTQRGFVLLGRTLNGSAAPSVVLIEIRDGQSRYESAGAPWSEGLDAQPASLASTDGRTAWFAVGTNYAGTGTFAGVVIGRFDTTTAPFEARTASLPFLRGYSSGNVVRLHVLSDDTAVLGVTSQDRLTLAWLGADMTILGQWSYPMESNPPFLSGASGTLADEGLVLRVDDQVRLARAFGPGAVAGGLRPLLDGSIAEVSDIGPHDGFGRVADGFALASWTPDLSLVTFCDGP